MIVCPCVCLCVPLCLSICLCLSVCVEGSSIPARRGLSPWILLGDEAVSLQELSLPRALALGWPGCAARPCHPLLGNQEPGEL